MRYGERKYSFYSLTSVLEGVSVTPRPRFTPGKGPWYPLYRRLGGPQSWLVWTQRLEKKKSFTSAGDRTPVVQSVVRHYTA
jgi:hypothetical protein